ncbi:peptide ABC transporter permease [Fictibacillus nanhaiensis]|uniref:peptide ABC transporter permease n=1 Tax=Fictibacillus nanhaiensis TaxID=742169 RepID=UPI002E1C3221|nr:peptide ABC transporter permease [Fictibacillus nanhaiensis]
MWYFFIRQKRAVSALVFLVTLVLLSIGNSFIHDGEIRRVSLLFDKNGTVSAAPFAPSAEFLLGTDRKGYDLLHLIIEGAKWTIGAGLLITFMRIFIGLSIAIALAKFKKSLFRSFESFFDSFSVIPMTMISYFLLQHVLTFSNGTTPEPFYLRVGFQMMILIIFAVPTITFYLGNEIKILLNEEFVCSSKILGGRYPHLLRKHIAPHLNPILIILFLQQFIQVLVILIHLGVLQVFFGGTIVFHGGDIDSVTHEWTGLLGMYYPSFMSHPWIPLVPILFFTLTIISSTFILSGLERAYFLSKQNGFKEQINPIKVIPAAPSFSFIEENKTKKAHFPLDG